MGYSDMLKKDLIKECKEKGINDDGLKAELIDRLEKHDEEIKVKAKKEADALKKLSKEKPKPIKQKDVRKKVWNPMLFRFEYK